MADIKYIEHDDGTYNHIVEYDFKAPLTWLQRAHVYQLVGECFTVKHLDKVLVTLLSFTVTVEASLLRLDFQRSTSAHPEQEDEVVKKLTSYDIVLNRMADFVWYIGAYVNTYYPLEPVSTFVPIFQTFIDFPYTLERDGFGRMV